MQILISKNYIYPIPNCSAQARTLIVLQAKQIFGKKLKNARMIKTDKRYEYGKLLKRTD